MYTRYDYFIIYFFNKVDSMKRNGILFYNRQIGKMDIAFHDGGTCGGLDMGAKLDVKVNGKWKRSRIEFGQGWYLVGVPQSNVEGLEVRL